MVRGRFAFQPTYITEHTCMTCPGCQVPCSLMAFAVTFFCHAMPSQSRARNLLSMLAWHNRNLVMVDVIEKPGTWDLGPAENSDPLRKAQLNVSRQRRHSRPQRVRPSRHPWPPPCRCAPRRAPRSARRAARSATCAAGRRAGSDRRGARPPEGGRRAAPPAGMRRPPPRSVRVVARPVRVRDLGFGLGIGSGSGERQPRPRSASARLRSRYAHAHGVSVLTEHSRCTCERAKLHVE